MRLSHSLSLAVAVAALAAPNALAQEQDLRSGDAMDAASAVQREHVYASPDAADLAAGRSTASAPDVVVVKVAPPTESTTHADGDMHWTDAGIGAAGMLGLVLVGTGGVAVLSRRHPRAVA